MPIEKRRPWLLIVSIVAAFVTGVMTTLLVAAKQYPTPWVAVPVLVFLTIVAGVKAVHWLREETETQLVLERMEQIGVEPDPLAVVPDTLPDGRPI